MYFDSNSSMEALTMATMDLFPLVLGIMLCITIGNIIFGRHEREDSEQDAKTEEDEETDLGYVPEVERYRIEKEKQELNRIETDLEIEEKKVELRDRKRELIRHKYNLKHEEESK